MNIGVTIGRCPGSRPGSLAGSTFACNGVIGAAVAGHDTAGEWRILPPLVSADGLNNELERPHVIHGMAAT